MNLALETALLALLLFQIKHFLADFVFQTLAQVKAKGRYGARGGLSHAALHAVLSLPAFFVLTGTLPMGGTALRLAALPAIGLLMLIEFAVHYHVDYAKARIDARYSWGVTDQEYWIVFGTDQFLHQMTYWGMVWWMVRTPYL